MSRGRSSYQGHDGLHVLDPTGPAAITSGLLMIDHVDLQFQLAPSRRSGDDDEEAGASVDAEGLVFVHLAELG